ncbi:6035_t:CDS:2 [Diversispora eburnea]|uniref:6035_t:CDS:1 n=1 Tax=Diversispora eburnea TaxID=1213867 RepID=A0A9N9AXB0_9GLOM|nr:6035_t:CDS:2 [Diversispora eburnea]
MSMPMALDGKNNNYIGNCDDGNLKNNDLALDIGKDNSNIDNTLALDGMITLIILALDGRDEDNNNISEEDDIDDNINNTLDGNSDYNDEFFNDVFPSDGDANVGYDIYYDHLTLDENEVTMALENLILDLGSLLSDRDTSTLERNT